jgi:hypothetical protein
MQPTGTGITLFAGTTTKKAIMFYRNLPSILANERGRASRLDSFQAPKLACVSCGLIAQCEEKRYPVSLLL